jgi:hypothetical protein
MTHLDCDVAIVGYEELRAAVVSHMEVRDVDGALTAWLAAAGAAAVIVRPDSYVFGAVPRLGDLPALVDDVRAQLTTRAPMVADA